MKIFTAIKTLLRALSLEFSQQGSLWTAHIVLEIRGTVDRISLAGLRGRKPRNGGNRNGSWNHWLIVLQSFSPKLREGDAEELVKFSWFGASAPRFLWIDNGSSSFSTWYLELTISWSAPPWTAETMAGLIGFYGAKITPVGKLKQKPWNAVEGKVEPSSDLCLRVFLG